jgi:ribosomal 50S subunit-associated protein YjgA (DUF615 family)
MQQIDIVDAKAQVAEVFPTADAVNDALRLLIRITQKNQF